MDNDSKKKLLHPVMIRIILNLFGELIGDNVGNYKIINNAFVVLYQMIEGGSNANVGIISEKTIQNCNEMVWKKNQEKILIFSINWYNKISNSDVRFFFCEI